MFNARNDERRFRVDSLAVDDRGTIAVSADVARHLKVLRLDVGAEVSVFDGSGGEARALLLSIADDGAVLKILETVQRHSESPLRITLVQAVPVRAERMETIVRQLTELGIERFLPVITERSRQVKGGAAWGRKTERWQRIADSAAEQSGRVVVPTIDEPVPFAGLDWARLARPLWVAHPAAAEFETVAKASAAPAAWAGSVKPVATAVMVGPEGGWTPQELEVARQQGAIGLALGPRILRADTAGAVVVAVLQYRWGDLGSD